jgi:hypothetical protein
MDVGSGMGRPPLSAASAAFCNAVGIELQPMAVAMSLLALRNFHAQRDRVAAAGTVAAGWAVGEEPGRVFFDTGNVMDVASLDGVTHLYSFNVGMPPVVIKRIAALAAWSPSVKVLALYDAGKPADLVRYGVLDTVSGATDIIPLSMKMPGSHSYRVHIVPITPARRKRLRKMHAAPVSMNPDAGSFIEAGLDVLQDAEAYATYVEHIDVAAALDAGSGEASGRPRRACAATASS